MVTVATCVKSFYIYGAHLLSNVLSPSLGLPWGDWVQGVTLLLKKDFWVLIQYLIF